MVKIHHKINGISFYTLYGHMQNNSLLLKNGDKVLQGQKIGTQGTTGNSTGDHLHFEIIDENNNTIDPYPYLFIGNLF